jgi:ATP-dependent protease ClpP protease subunit
MTKDRMPANVALPLIARAECFIPATALEKWQPLARAGEDDAATISILEPIGADFFGEGVTAKRISGALRAIGPKDVTVTINSPGGSFFEGLAIYNLLRNHPARVTVEVVGVAASAASFIAMAGDEIRMADASFLMIHNTQMIAMGDRNTFLDVAEEMAAFDDVLAGIYAVRSGRDKKAIARMLDEETWLSGADAVKQGLADAVFDPKPGALTNRADGPELNALRVVDTIMAQANVSRDRRRKLLNRIKGTPRAATPPSDTQDAVAAGLQGLIDFANTLKSPV